MSLDLFRVSGGLQIDESTQILEGAQSPVLDAPVGSLYTNTTTGELFTKVAAGAGASTWEVLAKNSYVTSQLSALSTHINALGNAFVYVGTVAGGPAGSPADLSALTDKNPGDYYKVTVGGTFTDGTNTFVANVGDGLVFNLSGSVDKIDSTDSVVTGTADFVSVTGTTDTGFVVDVADAFKNRVSTLETNATALEARVTTTEGNVTALTSALATETSARQAADETLQANIDAETSARQAADVTLQANIDAETSARQAADQVLTDELATETSARQAADVTLQANIDAETTARQAADETLQANIDAETSARQAADETLQANIDALQSALQPSSAVVKATAATSATDSVPELLAKWLVYVRETASPANVQAYEVFAASNGMDVDYSRFGILRLGAGVAGASAVVSQTGYTMTLAVTTTAYADITIKRVAVV